MCEAGMPSAKPGSRGSITPAARRTFGVRTRSAISNGTESQWVDQPEPVFVAKRIGSMEACMNPISSTPMASGRCGMSPVRIWKIIWCKDLRRATDGRNWSKRKIFIPAEEKVFDFCVIKGQQGYEAVFSRVWLGKTAAPASTGLWWCQSADAIFRFQRLE